MSSSQAAALTQRLMFLFPPVSLVILYLCLSFCLLVGSCYAVFLFCSIDTVSYRLFISYYQGHCLQGGFANYLPTVDNLQLCLYTVCTHSMHTHTYTNSFSLIAWISHQNSWVLCATPRNILLDLIASYLDTLPVLTAGPTLKNQHVLLFPVVWFGLFQGKQNENL